MDGQLGGLLARRLYDRTGRGPYHAPARRPFDKTLTFIFPKIPRRAREAAPLVRGAAATPLMFKPKGAEGRWVGPQPGFPHSLLY